MEKERRTKALVIVVMLIVVAGLTIAFAALSTTLNINGTAYLDAAKWGIKFENLSEPVSVGTASTSGAAKIEETKSAEINGINVSLSTPGDKVTYTVDLVNEGTINAKIDKIEKTELTSEQQKYLTFKVTDKDGKEVSEGDILSSGETRNLTITIEFIKDLTKEDLPKQTSTISLSYKLNFVQTDDKTTTTNNTSQQACTSFEKKDTYNVGDVIALCNAVTNKSEDFYVIKDNGDTVEALAKYNLLVGSTVVMDDEFSDITSSTPISSLEEGYGLQNKKTDIALSSEGEPLSNTLIGMLPFSSSAYWIDSDRNLISKYGDSLPTNVFDSNSNLYEPLQNYKNYLKNTLGKTSINVNLLSHENALTLGCKSNDCTSAPNWLYSNAIYWTSVYSNRTDGSIDAIAPDGSMNCGTRDFSEPLRGLRPVITISKSEL